MILWVLSIIEGFLERIYRLKYCSSLFKNKEKDISRSLYVIWFAGRVAFRLARRNWKKFATRTETVIPFCFYYINNLTVECNRKDHDLVKVHDLTNCSLGTNVSPRLCPCSYNFRLYLLLGLPWLCDIKNSNSWLGKDLKEAKFISE